MKTKQEATAAKEKLHAQLRTQPFFHSTGVMSDWDRPGNYKVILYLSRDPGSHPVPTEVDGVKVSAVVMGAG